MHRIMGLIAGVLMIVSTAAGQSIRVSFSAKDRHTTSAVQLDSVRIENLSTMRDTVIKGPFIIDLEISTGTDEYFPGRIVSLEISGNFANPFTDATNFTVTTGVRGPVQLELFSIAGRRVTDFEAVLERGAHHFSLKAASLPAGVYLLAARAGQLSRSVRIVKSGAAGGGSALFSHMGRSSSPDAGALRKAVAVLYRFTGYADTYDPEPVTAAPSQDTAIVFEMRRVPIAPVIDRFVCVNPVSFLGDTSVFEVAVSSALKSLSRILIDFEKDGIMDDSANASGASAQATFRRVYAAAGSYNARACVADLYGNTSCKDLDSAVTVLDPLPILTTSPVTEIKPTSARSGGDISNEGGHPVTARGVCWSTSPGPTISECRTSDGAGTGSFVSSITGLASYTTYYIRAYATNSAGTGYGNELVFTTADSSSFLPVLITTSVTEISPTTARSGGIITSDGGYPVTVRGVCWSTLHNPKTSDSKTNNGTGMGSYSSSITGLASYTTYYIRAYATNSAGTGYGNEAEFTTADPYAFLPVLTTSPVTEILPTTAKSGGDITSDRGYPVTARGVCWSTLQNPTTSDSKTDNGAGMGSFVSMLTGLAANTAYYVRAYAVNSMGTSYGNEVSFKTGQGSGGESVTIGTQVWMLKNLDVDKYRDGAPIPQVTDPAQWASLTTGAWCYYNNDPATGAIYGKLYNWYAVNDPRGLAPFGWHVPTDAEWTVLTTYLGGESVAGGKMKETGFAHWSSPNAGADNSSGFTALPGGCRGTSGGFGSVGTDGVWWSSSRFSAKAAWTRGLVYGDADLDRYNYDMNYGFSVRCVRE